MTSGLSVTDGAAWRSFCDRLAVVGESILAGDLQDERTRVEGFHHLATQVVTWLPGRPDTMTSSTRPSSGRTTWCRVGVAPT